MKAHRKPRRTAKEAAPKDAGPAPATTADNLIDMGEAIRTLKTTRPTFYRWLRSGKIKGMKVGRQWRFYRADIERFLKGEEPRIDVAADVMPLLDALSDRAETLGFKPSEPAATDAVSRIAAAVDLMVWLGLHAPASDIHVDPTLKSMGGEPVGTVRVRVDGVLQTLAEFDIRLLRALVERWKTMAGCNPHETQRPQDGRILIKVDGRDLDLRISFVPSALGEAITARILDASGVRLNFDATPFHPADKEKLRRHLQAPAGIILCVGPTGSGKTTTLYACLDQVNTPAHKIMSVEDPVEFLLPGVVQIPIRPSVGLTFAAAIRSVLRSDPDVILVGEIRDLETVNAAQQAALTGHLVLSTLHTAQAADALVRMVEMGAAPFVVADSTRAVVAQRLVRVLCPKCKRPAVPSADLIATAGQLALDGGLDWTRVEKQFHEPVGCPACRNIGFRGRTTMAEVLEVTPEIGAALRRGAKAEELQAIAIRQGMTTLAADGVRRAAAGQTTVTEVLRVLGVK